MERIMENSDNNLIKVNQHDIKSMLEERILHPRKYADKPLLIWRGYFEDNIQREVFSNIDPQIEELMHKPKQHSLNSNDDDRIHMGKEEVAIPRWINLKLYNLRNNAFFMPDKGSNPFRVFCFFFGLSEEDIVKPSLINEYSGIINKPPLYKEYSGIINKKWLIREKDCLKAPLVVYLPFVEEPEAFKGYDQYVFIPDFDEWKEENSKSQNLLIKHLIEFLESYESEEERNYRWYWYFQRQKNDESSSDLKSHFKGSGCDFPSCWRDGFFNLKRRFNIPMAQIPKNYIPPKPVKISEIPVDEFKAFFNVGISEDVVDDFRKYLIEHNVEIQGNIKNPYISD